MATQVQLAPDPCPRLIRIPRFSDERGALCVIDFADTLPFTPGRLYYIHSVTDGATRAGHAHFQGEELVLCLTGAMRVITDDGHGREEFSLERPDVGLYIPRLVWHDMYGFSSGTVCAVLASGRYLEEDYCRDYQQFLRQAIGRSRVRRLP